MNRLVLQRIALLGLVGAATILFGCDEDESAEEGKAAVSTARRAGPNAVVISLDTLRADRLGSYGHRARTSPALDALAARGTRFEHAFAEATWTLPSHMTLFTGLHPSAHGVTRSGRRLPDEVPSLGQLLAKNGVRAFAFTEGGYVRGDYGFDRGFESYRSKHGAGLRETLTLARKRIESLPRDDRYFLFLHTYDIHCPYDPPKRYRDMFVTRPAEDQVPTAGRCGAHQYNKMNLTKGQVAFISEVYDAGIRWTDDALGEFFAFLDEREAFEHTYVIVTSDHGEEFHEHGKIGHGHSLYMEQLRVPLLIAGPDIAPRVIASPAGLADILPTLVDLLRLEGMPPVQGRSLAPLLSGKHVDWADRLMFAERDEAKQEGHRRSVVRGSHHFLDTFEGSQELYDWRRDPTEQENLAEEREQSTSELAAALSRHEKTVQQMDDVQSRQLSEREKAQLRALGYAE